MQGPDSWEGRPRNIKTIQVSKLSADLRADFKTIVGKRRWTTEVEVQRILALRKIHFKREAKGDIYGEPTRWVRESDDPEIEFSGVRDP